VEVQDGTRKRKPRAKQINNLGERLLVCHEREKDSHELKVNSNKLQGVYPGDILELTTTDVTGTRILLAVKQVEENPGNWEISLVKFVANYFGFKSYQHVMVRLMQPNILGLHWVSLTFKNMYLSRSDMWRFSRNIKDRCLYEEEHIEAKGVTARVQIMKKKRKGGNDLERVLCGVVTEKTRFVFRSSCAEMHFLVQISREMFQFADDGDTYFEKCLQFFETLFEKWRRKDEVKHVYSITFFCRFILKKETQALISDSENAKKIEDPRDLTGESAGHFCISRQNEMFQDFYHPVLHRETTKDWKAVSRELKRALNILERQTKVMFNRMRRGHHDFANKLSSSFCDAAEGNFLEAIGLVCNDLEKHYIDRKLDKTGLSICTITAGSGFYFTDRQMTKYIETRVLDNGIGCDIVSLTMKPLHVTPLFIFKGDAPPPRHREWKHWENYEFGFPIHWLQIKYFESKKLADDTDEFKPLPAYRMIDYSVLTDFQDTKKHINTQVDKIKSLPFSSVKSATEYDDNVFCHTKFALDQKTRESVDLEKLPSNFEPIHESSTVATPGEVMEEMEEGEIDNPAAALLHHQSSLESDDDEDNIAELLQIHNSMGILENQVPVEGLEMSVTTQQVEEDDVEDDLSVEDIENRAEKTDTQVKIYYLQFPEGFHIRIENIEQLKREDMEEREGRNFRNPLRIPDLSNWPIERWGHLSPESNQFMCILTPEEESNWVSLLNPAILPLTTPTNHKFPETKTFPWSVDARQPEKVWTELIAQRLAMDFQIEKLTTQPFHYCKLRTTSSIHEIELRPGSNQIMIKKTSKKALAEKYEQRFDNDHIGSLTQFQTSFSMWNDHRNKFVTRRVAMVESHELTDFITLDQWIASRQTDIFSGYKQKFRHVRFVVLPPEDIYSISDETRRLSIKVKFFDTLSEFFRELIGKNSPKLKNECVGPSSGFRLERAEIEESTMNNLKNDVGFGWFDESKKHVFHDESCGWVDVQLKSQWEGRRTLVSLKYDTEVDGETAWHLEVHWLVASGVQIQKWLNDRMRTAKEKFGLRLQTIPAAKFAESLPFLSAVSTGKTFGELSPTVMFHAERALLFEFNFVLDSRAPIEFKQFLHRSLSVLVRVVDIRKEYKSDGCQANGFKWIPNSIECNRSEKRATSIHLWKLFSARLRDLQAQYEEDALSIPNISLRSTEPIVRRSHSSQELASSMLKFPPTSPTMDRAGSLSKVSKGFATNHNRLVKTAD